MKASHPDHAQRCRDFLERLSRYLDNDLPSRDRLVIEKHLTDCPCCEEVLESLKETVALCHDKGRVSIPRDVRTRARARVRELMGEMAQKH